jgi:hypothetical protein
VRQQLAQREPRAQRVQIDDPDRAVVGREFAQLLPAAAAGRDRVVGHATHHHRLHATPPGGHHDGQCRCLGAPALRVGRVLDVAAGVDAALFVEHRRAHGEARVGRVGVLAHRARRRHQRVPPVFNVP